MHDETPSSHEQNPDASHSDSATAATECGRSPMRARTWTIAAQYAEPADYGIPKLPDWTVLSQDCRGMALADSEGAEPFIRAEQPMSVRR